MITLEGKGMGGVPEALLIVEEIETSSAIFSEVNLIFVGVAGCLYTPTH